jgi:hypothetical protein
MSRTKLLRRSILAVAALQAGCMLRPDYLRSADALAQAETARTIQVVALFKALGGGRQSLPDTRIAAR